MDFFNKANIPNLGIEPTLFTSRVAKKKGIKVINDFFSLSLAKKLAKKLNKIDLIIANNVIAHIPDLNNFVKGLSLLINKYHYAKVSNGTDYYFRILTDVYRLLCLQIKCKTQFLLTYYINSLNILLANQS